LNIVGLDLKVAPRGAAAWAARLTANPLFYAARERLFGMLAMRRVESTGAACRRGRSTDRSARSRIASCLDNDNDASSRC
jgi:hypothetical protein